MRRKQYETLKRLDEHDVPITSKNGELLTPEYIYKNRKRVRPSLSIQPDWNLLEKRLETKLKKGTLSSIYILGEEMSPEKQLEEVRNRTALGYKIMLAEHGLLEYLLNLE